MVGTCPEQLTRPGLLPDTCDSRVLLEAEVPAELRRSGPAHCGSEGLFRTERLRQRLKPTSRFKSGPTPISQALRPLTLGLTSGRSVR